MSWGGSIGGGAGQQGCNQRQNTDDHSNLCSWSSAVRLFTVFRHSFRVNIVFPELAVVSIWLLAPVQSNLSCRQLAPWLSATYTVCWPNPKRIHLANELNGS